MQLDNEFCTICGCGNPELLRNHDPEFHVAFAYHKAERFPYGYQPRCISCKEPFPCKTFLTYRIGE